MHCHLCRGESNANSGAKPGAYSIVRHKYLGCSLHTEDGGNRQKAQKAKKNILNQAAGMEEARPTVGYRQDVPRIPSREFFI